MDKDELYELFKDNTKTKKKVSAAAVANINKFADVSLRMDGRTLDYYYEVYVDSLLQSKIPKAEIKAMEEQGWMITKDKKNLRIYLKDD